MAIRMESLEDFVEVAMNSLKNTQQQRTYCYVYTFLF